MRVSVLQMVEDKQMFISPSIFLQLPKERVAKDT